VSDGHQGAIDRTSYGKWPLRQRHIEVTRRRAGRRIGYGGPMTDELSRLLICTQGGTLAATPVAAKVTA